MISWRLYVLVAAVLAFLGVGGYAAYERQSAAAARSEAELARKERDGLLTQLAQSEIDKAALEKARNDLDVALAAREKRQVALAEAYRKLEVAYAEIQKTVAPEDQACLARDLPPAILARLRDGTADGNADKQAESPREPAAPVPEAPAS